MSETTRAAIFIIENLGIVLGYLFLALYVVPRVTVNLKRTRFGGVGFFLTCGLTHLDQAIHTWFEPDEAYRHISAEWHMLLIHGFQLVFVYMFVSGLYLEFVKWGPWPEPTSWERHNAQEAVKRRLVETPDYKGPDRRRSS